jgi:hypothetical protein
MNYRVVSDPKLKLKWEETEKSAYRHVFKAKLGNTHFTVWDASGSDSGVGFCFAYTWEFQVSGADYSTCAKHTQFSYIEAMAECEKVFFSLLKKGDNTNGQRD